jgi:ribonuclease Z
MVKLFFVGTGTPTPTAERFGTCYILQIAEEYIMFDCGPAATYKMVKMGIRPTEVNSLFFSHHHFDHNADYPCFLLCRWDQSIGGEGVLRIWGPSPTEWITDGLIGAEGSFNHDWKARVEHPGSQEIFMGRGGKLPRSAPIVFAKDIDSGDEINGTNWRIKSVGTKHIEPWMKTLAYRVETDHGSITLTSDSGYCPGVVELARDTDYMLVHCWGFQSDMKRAEASMITGTHDAARLASDSNAHALILSHCGPSLANPSGKERGIMEVSAIYDGEIIFPEEMTTMTLY